MEIRPYTNIALCWGSEDLEVKVERSEKELSIHLFGKLLKS